MIDFDEDYYALYMFHPPEKAIHKNLYYLEKIRELESELKWLNYVKFHNDSDIDDQLRADRQNELEDSLNWYKVKLKQLNNQNKKFV